MGPAKQDPPESKPQPAPAPNQGAPKPELDEEIDRELDDTFPASDPLPWSHEVK